MNKTLPGDEEQGEASDGRSRYHYRNIPGTSPFTYRPVDLPKGQMNGGRGSLASHKFVDGQPENTSPPRSEYRRRKEGGRKIPKNHQRGAGEEVRPAPQFPPLDGEHPRVAMARALAEQEYRQAGDRQASLVDPSTVPRRTSWAERTYSAQRSSAVSRVMANEGRIPPPLPRVESRSGPQLFLANGFPVINAVVKPLVPMPLNVKKRGRSNGEAPSLSTSNRSLFTAVDPVPRERWEDESPKPGQTMPPQSQSDERYPFDDTQRDFLSPRPVPQPSNKMLRRSPMSLERVADQYDPYRAPPRKSHPEHPEYRKPKKTKSPPPPLVLDPRRLNEKRSKNDRRPSSGSWVSSAKSWLKSCETEERMPRATSSFYCIDAAFVEGKAERRDEETSVGSS